MILVVGTPGEDPVSRLLEEAEHAGIATTLLDETAAAGWDLQIDGQNDHLRVQARGPSGVVELTEATGLYLRITAPKVHDPVPDPLRFARAEAALSMICAWSDVTPIRVANRPTAMASNGSKPYQAALIRQHGFAVPETLVTNDPAAVRDFVDRHGRVIYKSTSGVRSIVHELTPDRLTDLERVRNLSTQFQQLLVGTNVRVHVIGSEVFAAEIASETVDYRYREGGESARMTAVELPDDLAQRCLDLSAALDLPLAGIDLFRDADDQWWCFEVNPSPAYSCFEGPTGLPMAASLTRWLDGRAVLAA